MFTSHPLPLIPSLYHYFQSAQLKVIQFMKISFQKSAGCNLIRNEWRREKCFPNSYRPIEMLISCVHCNCGHSGCAHNMAIRYVMNVVVLSLVARLRWRYGLELGTACREEKYIFVNTMTDSYAPSYLAELWGHRGLQMSKHQSNHFTMGDVAVARSDRFWGS